MATPENIEDAIEQNALGPKRAQHGQDIVDQHSISEQIKADRYVKGNQASTKPGFGLRFQKIRPVYE